MQDLFRTDWPGVSSGPLVSQFMLADFDIDGIVVTPKAKTLVPNVEYMTGVDTWLNVQVRNYFFAFFAFFAVQKFMPSCSASKPPQMFFILNFELG